MIDPAVAVHSLDGSGYELLTQLFAERDRNSQAEVHVLHEGGRVLTAVHTSEGPLSTTFPDFSDAAALAAELRRAHDVSRVVVVDADRLAGGIVAAESEGASDASQPELLLRMGALFWSSPAVVADPPVLSTGDGDWLKVKGLLEGLCTGTGETTIVLVARGGDGSDAVKFLTRFRSGRMTEWTACPDDLLASLRSGRRDDPRTHLIDVGWDELSAGLLTEPDRTLASLLAGISPA